MQGFVFGPALSPQSSCSTAWTIPWIFSATTISHHLHTKLACPFCHIRSSVLKTSCLPSAFFPLLYNFFPFSTCCCSPCCTLLFIDLLPCILLSAPTLPSQIPTEPFQLVSAMLHTAEHLQWEPHCLANFLHYKHIAPPFSSVHFLDLLLQLKSQSHSHSHLFATFGSFLRPSLLLQPPLQLLHRISPSSSMRRMTNCDLPLPVALSFVSSSPPTTPSSFFSPTDEKPPMQLSSFISICH